MTLSFFIFVTKILSFVIITTVQFNLSNHWSYYKSIWFFQPPDLITSQYDLSKPLILLQVRFFSPIIELSSLLYHPLTSIHVWSTIPTADFSQQDLFIHWTLVWISTVVLCWFLLILKHYCKIRLCFSCYPIDIIIFRPF